MRFFLIGFPWTSSSSGRDELGALGCFGATAPFGVFGFGMIPKNNSVPRSRFEPSLVATGRTMWRGGSRRLSESRCWSSEGEMERGALAIDFDFVVVVVVVRLGGCAAAAVAAAAARTMWLGGTRRLWLSSPLSSEEEMEKRGAPAPPLSSVSAAGMLPPGGGPVPVPGGCGGNCTSTLWPW